MLGEKTKGQMSAWICFTVSCGQKICPNSFPHHGPLLVTFGFLSLFPGFAVWVPMRFQLQNVYPRRWESLGCSVFVNSWLSKDEGISFCRENCTWQSGSFGRPWLKRFAGGLPELCLQCGAVKGLKSVLQFSLQIRVEWYDERNCSICFRIRLEKKVAYLDLGLMDCSMIIKSSCIETTTEQSDKLHEFHDSDVCSTGGKLYTSPVLHCSSPRLFPIEWWMANWFEAILILSACPAYFISIFRYCTQFATCYVHKWISNDLKHAQWFELLPFCSMQQVSAFLSVFSGWRIAKTDATRPWCFVKGLLTQMWRL